MVIVYSCVRRRWRPPRCCFWRSEQTNGTEVHWLRQQGLLGEADVVLVRRSDGAATDAPRRLDVSVHLADV